jgi:hypothetical protein
MTTFADPATTTAPRPPAHVLRGPEHADNYRIKVGRYRDRWYRDPLPADSLAPVTADDEAYPSVSTVKGASGKDWTFVGLKRVAFSPDLMEVASKEPYERYERLKVINSLDLSAAMRRGTNVHTWAECLAYGVPQFLTANDAGADYFGTVDRLFADLQPELVAAEVVAFHRTINGAGYGGTADGIFRIDGKTYMVDWKSRGEESDHGAYAEEAAQLGAYCGAQYMIVADDDPANPHGAKRIQVPHLDGALIVSIKPDSYEVYPVELGRAMDYFQSMHSWWLARRDEHKTTGAKWAPRRAVEPKTMSVLEMAQRRMAADAEREADRRLAAEGGPADPDDVKLYELRWEMGLTNAGRRWLSTVVEEAIQNKVDFRMSVDSTQRRCDLFCALTEYATVDVFDSRDDRPLRALLGQVSDAPDVDAAPLGRLIGSLSVEQATALRGLITELAAL